MPGTEAVRSHLAHSSIRGQTSTQRKKQQAAATGTATVVKGIDGKREKSVNDRPLVKAVLASPLLPKWPDLHPAFDTVLALLCEAMPEVATYHTSRDRCKADSKRHNKKLMKKVSADAAPQAPIPMEIDTDIVPSSLQSQPPPSPKSEKLPPRLPSILQYMVIGINEVVKTLEKQKTQLEIEVDALIHGREPKMDLIPAGVDQHTLIVTASATVPNKEHTALGRPNTVPLRAIFVCVHDVNPRELVDHLPTYVSTFNGLVQHSRSKLEQWCQEQSAVEGKKGENAVQRARQKIEYLGREGEVLLVPFAKGAEQVLAHAVGLRRISMLGVTAQFPHLDVLLKHATQDGGLKPLLPPFQLYALAPPAALAAQLYAPTRLKAVHTTVPADAKARKVKRVEEVKRVRQEKKKLKEAAKARMKVVGMMVKGKLFGGTDQKKRDRQAKKEKRKRVEQIVETRQKRRKIKAKGKQN
ncbi:hypothetical protein QFC22_002225 [Naganishia vaughanmartiniae]|uniref:Uncharacterized protein n=1 Tax=Naganishia vaughanmartiniae TaxID=1424756 RepID=A0ACC2XDY4_9TREE|nr:hypothetical protein QFC22_002225 [Naganishia vaughanmartiniae]